MKIIFITSPGQDILEDAVFHGLRTLFGTDCVDYPKKGQMYRSFIIKPGEPNYGNFFTIWRTLDDIAIDRENIPERIRKKDYDLIVFGSIHRSYELFRQFRPYLKKSKTILLDGEDHITFRNGTRGFLYFKRELTPKIRYYRSYKLTPRFLYNMLPIPSSIKPIAFSIPKEKITYGVTRESKEKLLPTHIVDEEVRNSDIASSGPGSSYLFTSEADYYNDLHHSKFGITTKRGGWDCLRHYEIAANGAVICFRNLTSKPASSAPHGLDPTNTMIYNSADDLKRQIEKLSDSDYDRMLENGYRWIVQQTTETRAKEILDTAKAYFAT